MEPESPAKFREEPASLKNRFRVRFFFFSLFFVSLFFALMFAYWKRERLMEHLGITAFEKTDNRFVDRFSEIEQRLDKIESDRKAFESRMTDLPSRPLSSSADFDERLKTIESALVQIQEKLQKEQLYRSLDRLLAKVKISEPFTIELEKALKATQEHKELQESLMHLQEFAPFGIPPLATLMKELDVFEKASTEDLGKESGTLWEKTKRTLTGYIRIEKREEGKSEEKKVAYQDLPSSLRKSDLKSLKAAIETVQNISVPKFLEDQKTAWLRHAEAWRIALEAETLLSEILLNEF